MRHAASYRLSCSYLLHFRIVILQFAPAINSCQRSWLIPCVVLMAYHLTCPVTSSVLVIIILYSSFFLPEFVRATSISFHYPINLKISMIIDLYLKFPLETFHSNQSCMTDFSRHFVFFLIHHIKDRISWTKIYF